jgi:hypothetical protein
MAQRPLGWAQTENRELIMAQEGKYGKITTERGSIPDDEPVFLLRAQDRLSVQAIEAYMRLCQVNGCPSPHLEALDEVFLAFVNWQGQHPRRVKIPGTGAGTGRP